MIKTNEPRNVVKHRHAALRLAKKNKFDLVVIGGGICGAGIAQNAAAHGLSVLLLDKADFSSGSSSRSNQLIHTDIPYIQAMRFNLTKQLCEERERLKRLAPHLIKEVSFVLPLLRDNTIFNLRAALGLRIYDLANIASGKSNAHNYLNRNTIANLAPDLCHDRVSGGIQFQDAITNDARLVIAVIKSAQESGAVALNYAQASGFRLDAGKITGVNCRDRYSGEEFQVTCKLCVNASGVWTDEVSRTLSSPEKVQASQTKSTQIVVSASSLDTNSALLIPAKDGRFVSVLPWQHALLIGPATSTYDGQLDQVRSVADETDYLLDVVNAYLDGQRQLNPSDVKASFAALSTEVPSHKLRANSAAEKEHTIVESTNGLVSVVGARISNYRCIATEILERLISQNPGLLRKATEHEHSMLGGWADKADFLLTSAEIETKGRQLSIDPASIQHLISNYGSEALELLALVEQKPSLNERIIADFPDLLVEVPFSIKNEMTISLQDFFFRRSRLGYLDQAQTLVEAPRVAQLMQETLGWDLYRTKVELSALESELAGTTLEENVPSLSHEMNAISCA